MRRTHIAMILGVATTMAALATAFTGFDSEAAHAPVGAVLPEKAYEHEAGEENEGPPDEWLLTRRMYGSRISVAQLARASADAQRLRDEARAEARGVQAS